MNLGRVHRLHPWFPEFLNTALVIPTSPVVVCHTPRIWETLNTRSDSVRTSDRPHHPADVVIDGVLLQAVL